VRRTGQTTADLRRLGPEEIYRVFRKWLKRIPLSLRTQDREAGYDWDLSIWQMEVSLTQIFDRPLRERKFFEEAGERSQRALGRSVCLRRHRQLRAAMVEKISV
jgi:hypothetical protein